MNGLPAGALELLLVAGAIFYGGLVLMTYRTDGPCSQLRLELGNPARSAQRLLVWLGVKTVAFVLRALQLAFNMLSETSAEVGEWFLRRRNPEVQAAFRSRFLV
jgi:hypothetical protein